MTARDRMNRMDRMKTSLPFILLILFILSPPFSDAVILP